MIPIYKPYITKQNLEYAHQALDSGWISSQGEYLDLTKDELKKIGYNNHKIILTNNGTAATHLMAVALKYKYPHITKIIVPNNVYVAAWNAFLYSKDHTLIAIDSNIDNWNFDINAIEPLVDEQTAILVVHNIGNVVNVPELKNRFPKTVILEDNCEGFLGTYDNQPTGSSGFCSAISFFGNKTLTSGEGGAFVTSDPDTFLHINKIKNQGQSDQRFLHHDLGYNYRMTNIEAAILYGQLKDIDYIIKAKQNIFKHYKDILQDIPNIRFQKIENNTTHSYWMLGVRIKNLNKQDKKKLELHMYESGVDTRPMFYSIKEHKYLSSIKCISDTNSKILQDQCIILPSYPTLRKNQIEYICDKLYSFLRSNNNV
jgi:perosamine synthetase|tara:strand:- start:5175 stop:6287 length:1113 start_codon:yes stop_codon:yes gene_type:complete